MSNLNERQIYQLSYPTLVKELGKRNLSTKGDLDILRTRLIHNCKGYDPQPYQFVAVIDFEATCMAKPPVYASQYIQEIIEFPIVLIDVTERKIIDTFHSYCQPVVQPILTDYCKDLTGLTQEQVDNALVFRDVFMNVEKWLIDRNLISNSEQKCLFITDGPADFNRYLRMQCEISNLTYPKWAHQWFNVKKAFAEFYSVKPGRIHKMLEDLHIQPYGNLHSGLDDATNIGRIVIELIKDGCVLLPNEFYIPSMQRNAQLLTGQSVSTRMICLNCSRSHSEDQRSCMQDVPQREQRSRSHYPRYPTNQSMSSERIPSLLDLPYPHTSNTRNNS
ncbi:hypothetical protein I4U23_011740 [Adineta vaga]|nr:hypothetical protein I4U23_011740 [Adineta vaga]